ncbi:unnamed protein product [marine sediment metagenome]|uniref:Uncharacterized protein n=1 Tax=marine sediment metagenome TaxID=412755 RepID=X1LBF5_9ZZZZ
MKKNSPPSKPEGGEKTGEATVEKVGAKASKAAPAQQPTRVQKRDPSTITNFGELYEACWHDFKMDRQAVWAELNVSSQEEITDLPSECYRKIAAVRQ